MHYIVVRPGGKSRRPLAVGPVAGQKGPAGQWPSLPRLQPRFLPRVTHDRHSSRILSGFADEAANQKTAVQQFAVFAALGLQYYSIRFIDVGDGVKNVMKLTKNEIQKVRHLQNEYGLNVSSMGSPIGKVKLLDQEDGTKNAYVPFKRYLANDVARACELAHALETKLIRGFSFYHPKGTDPRNHIRQAADQLAQIAEACHRSDLTFGLEVEPNLVGENGHLLAEFIARSTIRPCSWFRRRQPGRARLQGGEV